jgi:predicted nucleic acid-binding protein
LARLVAGEHTITGLSEDSEDDKYIAAGIEGRAALLVSGDPDLLTLQEHQGVRIITPRTLLDLLGA